MRLKDGATAKKLWLLIIVVILALGVMLIGIPSWNSAQLAKRSIDQAQQERQSAQNQINSYRASAKDYDANKNEAGRIADKFPSTLDTPELVNLVYTSIDDVGISRSNVNNFTITPPNGVTVTVADNGAVTPSSPSAGDETPSPAGPAPAEGTPSAPDASAPAAASGGGGSLGSATISLAVNGNIEQLNNLVDELTSAPVDFTLANYSLSKSNDGMTANIEGRTTVSHKIEAPNPPSAEILKEK